MATHQDRSPSDPMSLMPWISRTYPRGVELVQPDVVPNVLFVLTKGLLKLVHVGVGGREHILTLWTPPQLVGAAAVIANQPLGAVVTATTCHVDEVSADRFLAIVRERPEMLWQLYQRAAMELCSINQRMSEVRTLSPRDRLQRAFRLFVPDANARTRDVKLSIPITHREVAQLVGVTPEHLSRLLRQFEREALISRQRGWIIVRDLRRLDGADGAYVPAANRLAWRPQLAHSSEGHVTT